MGWRGVGLGAVGRLTAAGVAQSLARVMKEKQNNTQFVFLVNARPVFHNIETTTQELHSRIAHVQHVLRIRVF